MRRAKTFLVAAAAVVGCGLVSGCAVDSTKASSSDGRKIGQSAEALSGGILFFTWGGVGSKVLGGSGEFFNDGTSVFLDLGIDSSWTCFVAGVDGNLSGDGSVTVGLNYNFIPNVAETHWYLETNPAPGHALSGSAVCVPYSGLVQGDSQLKPGVFHEETLLTNAHNIDSFCGLGELYSSVAVDWSSSASFATISNNGTNADSIPADPYWTWTEDTAESQPTCAEAPAKALFDWNIVAPSSGSVTMPLGTMPAGTACFLTSVSGRFADDNFGDGVSLSVSSAGKWSLTAANGKKATATCVD